MTIQALDGVRIVESSAFIAAPLCGLSLSLYGADVIRIDNIGGGIDYNRMPRAEAGRSFYWTGLNKNKRSVAINLKQAEGRDLVRRLVCAEGDDSGILLTNIGSSWLAHEQLKKIRADVITCTIEGNHDGSSAVDYTVNSATGYPFITGSASTTMPVNHALPAWDVICAHHASAALMAGVMQRRTTQNGSEIRIALSDIAFSTMSHLGLIAEAELSKVRRESLGNYIYGAFGRDFKTADGRLVMVAAVSSKQWASLVEACSLSESFESLEKCLNVDFKYEEDRYAHREAIADLVQGWCGAHTFSELAEIFARHQVCWGVFQTIEELVAHDKRTSLDNPLFHRLSTPGIGTHIAAGSPVRLAGLEKLPLAPAPYIGAQTERVLGEVLGLDSRQFRDLVAREIVAGPEKDPYYA